MEVNNLDQKMLKAFDEMLRCRICSEFFKGCVMTACSHNFCLTCLKIRLEVESDCPTCYEDIQEKELRSNRSMDKIVRIYKKLIKSNASQPSEIQAQTVVQSPLVPSLSADQTISEVQNYLPLQISSSETIPSQRTSLIHDNQLQSQSLTSLTISSTGTLPVHTVSPTETVTVPLIQDLPQTFPVKQEMMECDEREMQDLILVSTSHIANDSEDFQAKIVRLLDRNRQELESLKHLIADKECETGTNILRMENAPLPCKSRQELIHFNFALKAEDYFLQIYKTLRTVGGANEGDVVRKCLSCIMKNSVALQYNWRGLRGEKLPFSKLENIVGLTFRVANYRYKEITRQTVNGFIKDWLMRASDRDGGRKKRKIKHIFERCASLRNNVDGANNIIIVEGDNCP